MIAIVSEFLELSGGNGCFTSGGNNHVSNCGNNHLSGCGRDPGLVCFVESEGREGSGDLKYIKRPP